MAGLKKVWINAALLNLAVVALLGFILRSKILFPIDFIDYRNFLAAHGNFALAAWIGFSLMILLIQKLLPVELAAKRIYAVLLSLVFIFSWAMMLGYAAAGPARISIIFSFCYIISTYAFAWVFIKDLFSITLDPTIKWLAVMALICLVLASAGSIALALMYMGVWNIRISYRDASYIFLHFQYNGFFTLAIGALFLQYIFRLTGSVPTTLKRSANWIMIATIPSVFLSLLYYERVSYYVIGGITGAMLLVGCFYFLRYIFSSRSPLQFRHWIAKALWAMAAISFILKIIMQMGTLTPIGHAVYSDRPVIIGFLHMVFLAFGSFFILGILTGDGYFSRKGKVLKLPLIIFIAGVLANEIFLMIQGIEILLSTNNPFYNWLLWIASILLFLGALFIGISRMMSDKKELY